jgi:heterodisulfide reductase subunit A-like polyferredoxin
VDADKCAYCLTCLRVCPYGAMGKDPAQRVAQVIRTACQGCGICASECPAEAITLRNLDRDSVLTAMGELSKIGS